MTEDRTEDRPYRQLILDEAIEVREADVTRLDVFGETIELVLPLADDLIQRHIRKHSKLYEHRVLDAIRTTLLAADRRRVGWAIDVGANIGNHAVFFSRVLGLKTMCFEPAPYAFAVLSENMRRNADADRYQLHRSAVGASVGRARIEKAIDGNLGATMVAAAAEGELPLTTLDQECAGLPVALIKIDVEDMEEQVLEGGRAVIAAERPLLIIESRRRAHFLNLKSFLAPLDYAPTNVLYPTATPTFLFESGKRERGVADALYGLGAAVAEQNEALRLERRKNRALERAAAVEVRCR